MTGPSRRRDEHLDFLRGFLRRPQQVGSVVPSSRFLERRIVELAGIGEAQSVVELGPGTGGTTRALLRALPAGARLLAIELDPRFVRRIERIDDPRLVTHQGNAGELREIAGRHGLEAVDAVVSGIPFSTMPEELGRRILGQVRDLLAPGGRFVAYQVRDRVGELGAEVMGPPQVDLELRNLPPVRIFRWRRRDSARQATA